MRLIGVVVYLREEWGIVELGHVQKLHLLWEEGGQEKKEGFLQGVQGAEDD